MENSFFDSLYFAEFILTIGSLIILLTALFLKKNVFERISLFSILLLLFVSFIVIKDTIRVGICYGDKLNENSPYIAHAIKNNEFISQSYNFINHLLKNLLLHHYYQIIFNYVIFSLYVDKNTNY